MAGKRELEPPAERVTADRGNDRLARSLDGPHDLLAAAREPKGGFGIEVPQLGDVRTGDESPVAGAGEDDSGQRGVRAKFLEGSRERLHQVPVQRVESLRPIHGDEGEGMSLPGLAALAQEIRMPGHAAAPLPVPLPAALPAASTTMAIPWPPPIHAVARP